MRLSTSSRRSCTDTFQSRDDLEGYRKSGWKHDARDESCQRKRSVIPSGARNLSALFRDTGDGLRESVTATAKEKAKEKTEEKAKASGLPPNAGGPT